MCSLRHALAICALTIPLLQATAHAEEPSVAPPPDTPAAAVPAPARAPAPQFAYAPQATDAEVPRYRPLPGARLDLFIKRNSSEGAVPFSRQWKAGAGMTIGGILASGVGAVVGIYGLVQSFSAVDHGRSSSPAVLGVGLFGCALSVAGDVSFLVGVPVWISAAVKRHERGD